jgi:L-histidine N-alpha-methyltransferase
VPFDVDPAVLTDASRSLAAEFPDLTVSAVVGDFEHDLATIARHGRRTIAFLGSTIGNLEPAVRKPFLEQVAAALEPGDTFLLGTDLVKDVARLVAAYDDSAGVTAAFNRNVLYVVNRELHADFDVEAFRHVTLWDKDEEWIEMRLEATEAQHVTVAALDLTVDFTAGEQLRTEVSAKFRPETVEAELSAVGLSTVRFWTDPDDDFGLTLAARL